MGDRVSVKDFDFDTEVIECRKQLIRDLWDGKPLDHIPVHLTVENPEPEHFIREQVLNADAQWLVSVRNDPQAVHRRMREISEEYAKRMDWGWEEHQPGALT